GLVPYGGRTERRGVEDAGGREPGRAGQREARRLRRDVVHVEGRSQNSRLAHEARELRAGKEVPDGAVDPRRSVVDVRRRFQLELSELRRERIRRAADEPGRPLAI